MNDNLSEFNIIQAADWNLKKGILLRAYSPLGYYPINSFHHRDAAFVIGSDLIFSVVRFEEPEMEGYYLEQEWLTPAEIRLLASLSISASPWNDGKVFPYPLSTVYKIEDDSDIYIGDESIWFVFEEFIKKQLSSDTNSASYDPTQLPQFISGKEYDYNKNVLNEMKQQEVFEKIAIENHLLIRGLGALIKGNLLQRHYIFHTEACMSAHIAMEATLHIILGRLRTVKNNPSNEDASEYLAKELNLETYPQKYFEEYYEDRIKTVHPSNRFGTFPHPPLAADDFYDLYDDLVDVYYFLITGNTDLGRG